jgi:hypothetical protein
MIADVDIADPAAAHVSDVGGHPPQARRIDVIATASWPAAAFHTCAVNGTEPGGIAGLDPPTSNLIPRRNPRV